MSLHESCLRMEGRAEEKLSDNFTPCKVPGPGGRGNAGASSRGRAQKSIPDAFMLGRSFRPIPGVTVDTFPVRHYIAEMKYGYSCEPVLKCP